MKRWLPWLGLVISLLCAAYFVRAVSQYWQSLTNIYWGPKAILGMIVALGLYALTYAFVTRSWQLELRAVGHFKAYAELARIILTSQFGKYLPGNVGHHVGRVVLAKRAGLPSDAIVASLLLDTLLVLLAGAICSLPTLPLLLSVLNQHDISAGRTLIAATSATAVATVALLAIPALRGKLIALWRYGASLQPAAHVRLFFEAWLGQFTCFVLGASALYLLCNVISDAPPASVIQFWPQVVGVYATAWLLGFLMPGAPAGLGVRELVLLLGLSPLIGEQQATTAAAMLRLVTTVADGLVFTVAVCTGNSRAHGQGLT